MSNPQLSTEPGQLHNGLVREYGPLGINVNAIAPAVAETPMTQALFDEPGPRGRIVQTIPLPGLSHMREMAGFVVFLASDMAAYLNGSIVVIDGGLMTV